MKRILKNIKLKTGKEIEIVDISNQVREIVASSGIGEGCVNIITQHTTTAININEKEEGLQKDMIRFLKDIVPKEGSYIHNQNAADGRFNAHSHLMTLFANASETIPISNGDLIIGKWQSIFFIELDGPREERTVVLQIQGE